MSKRRKHAKPTRPQPSPEEITRRNQLVTLRRQREQVREQARITHSLHVSIQRTDRILREFAEFIMERDGDTRNWPKAETAHERELANT